MIRNFSRIAAVLGLAAVGNMAQAQLVIDRFTTGQPRVEVDAPGTATDSVVAADVLGGARDVRVDSLTGTASGVRIVTNFPGNGQGTLTYASDPFTTGIGIINYDGAADNAVNNSGLNDLDITAAGLNDGFLGEFASDSGAAFTITIFDGANSVTATRTVPGTSTAFTFSTFFIPFTEFTGGTVDLTKVDAVRVTIDGTNNAGTDVGVRFLRFSQNTTVPEPGTVALFAGAVAFGGLMVRRRLAK